MQRMRYGLIVLCMLLSLGTSAAAQVSIGIGLPNVSIGINIPLFPELVPVPGYPVYYAPRLEANYFFYDGMYWVYQNDYWYASSWYNGPWGLVQPEVVPLFILRIPVRYYRQPPVYFRGWRSDAPPRWGDHWGHGWEQRRRGWDRWDRSSAPRPAPLPVYQRQYSGDRYPRQVEQQQTLRSRHYRYQPRDTAVREHFKQHEKQRAPAPAQRGRKEEPPVRSPRQEDTERSKRLQQGGPAGQEDRRQRAPAVREDRQQRAPAVREERQQRAPAAQEERRQRAPAAQEQRQQPQREQQAPRSQGKEQRPQDRRESQEPKEGQGQERKKDEERGGRERNN